MRVAALILGGGAAVLLLPSLVWGGASAWAGYLAGLLAWAAIPLGALPLVAVSRLVTGQWAETLAPALTWALRTLPVAAVLFLPLLLVLPELYPWARPEMVPEGPWRALYLSEPAFIGRTVVYWLLWLALAWWVGPPAAPAHRRARGVLALAAYAVTVSLAGVDWVLSLDPEFNSSIFGLLFIAANVVAAMAFAMVVLFGPAARPAGQVGSLLLGSVLTWGYLEYMQYLVIWSGNIPHLASWYVRRLQDTAALGAWSMLLLQGVLPIAALSFARVRRQPRPLAAVGAVLLLAHAIRSAWLVLPEIEGLDALPAAAAFVGMLLLAALALLLLRPLKGRRTG